MRIAFDHQAFCLQKTGGISRYFFRLIEELERLGQEVGVFAPLYRNQYAAQLPNSVMHGRHVNDFPPYCADAAVSLNGMIARPQLRAWHPDVVHETYFSNVCSGNNKQPSVLTVFDMIPELGLDGSLVTQQMLRASKKYVAAKRADHIICISEQTRQDLIRLFDIDLEKTSTIHLGCDVLQPPSQQFDTDLTEKIPDKPFLLYVGLRGGYKNFNRFLQAVASSPVLKPSLNVIAFGGGPFDVAEQSLIQTLGFQADQIRQVSGDDALLAQHYSQASALVYPSTYEGFGLPPLEAMSLRCPVVSSHASVMPEICGNAAEYFAPLDIESIRQAIEAVLSSMKRRDELIANGIAQTAHYSWPICAERHFSLYQRLVNTSVFAQ